MSNIVQATFSVRDIGWLKYKMIFHHEKTNTDWVFNATTQEATLTTGTKVPIAALLEKDHRAGPGDLLYGRQMVFARDETPYSRITLFCAEALCPYRRHTLILTGYDGSTKTYFWEKRKLDWKLIRKGASEDPIIKFKSRYFSVSHAQVFRPLTDLEYQIFFLTLSFILARNQIELNMRRTDE